MKRIKTIPGFRFSIPMARIVVNSVPMAVSGGNFTNQRESQLMPLGAYLFPTRGIIPLRCSIPLGHSSINSEPKAAATALLLRRQASQFAPGAPLSMWSIQEINAWKAFPREEHIWRNLGQMAREMGYFLIPRQLR